MSIKLPVVLIFLGVFLFSKELIYTMPQDAKSAEKVLIQEFEKAKSSIDIAIYSFTHKKFAKALKRAAKRGVQINIITNERDAYKKNRIGYLAKYKNVHAYTLKGKRSRNGKYYGKMHLKIAIFDKTKIAHGSANWSYSAFGLNYETLIFNDSKESVDKFNSYYKELLKEAKEF